MEFLVLHYCQTVDGMVVRDSVAISYQFTLFFTSEKPSKTGETRIHLWVVVLSPYVFVNN